MGDSIELVGHDAKGDPLVEVRMPRRLLNARRVKAMERFCRDNDEAPDIKAL